MKKHNVILITCMSLLYSAPVLPLYPEFIAFFAALNKTVVHPDTQSKNPVIEVTKLDDQARLCLTARMITKEDLNGDALDKPQLALHGLTIGAAYSIPQAVGKYLKIPKTRIGSFARKNATLGACLCIFEQYGNLQKKLDWTNRYNHVINTLENQLNKAMITESPKATDNNILDQNRSTVTESPEATDNNIQE